MNRSIMYLISLILIVSFSASCSKDNDKEGLSVIQNQEIPSVLKPKGKSDPLFVNSVVSTEIDFIRETDLDAFSGFTYLGEALNEMPGGPDPNVLITNTYVFKLCFANEKELEVWCHNSFGSKEAAEGYVDKLGPRLGKLPKLMRDVLDHVVIHTGDNTAFAENVGHFFVVYSDNMDVRISNNDLEETVFHESVHAALQAKHEDTPEWKLAQSADGNFITDYALSKPSLEDMPESALFCYTVIKYPGRLSPEIENWVKDYIPNRLAFFKTIYE